MAKTYVIYTYKYKGEYMIGETTLGNFTNAVEAAKARIKQYLFAKEGVSAVDYADNVEDFVNDPRTDFKVYPVLDSNKNHVDTDFRKYILEHYSEARQLNKSEILVNITRAILDEAYNNWRNGDADAYRVDNYSLYPYQDKVCKEAIRILQTRNRCLIHLSTRGGKSIIALTAALNCNPNNILIATPMPAAKDSFKKVVERHMMFKGWKFFDKIEKNTKYNKDHNVVFLSWQMLSVDNNTKKVDKQKLEHLMDQVKFDVIIIDETHHTADSLRSGNILSVINPNNSIKEIHLSGTPYNDILSSRFDKDETVTFDFIDLLTLDKKTHEVKFPKLNIFNVCNREFLNESLVAQDPTVFEREEGFTLGKAFTTEVRTQRTLDWIFKKTLTIDNVDSISEVEEKSRNFFNGKTNKHIMMYLPSVESCGWAKEYLEYLIENAKGIFSKYKVDTVSGPTNKHNNSNTIEKEINDFEKENEYTIVISCDRLKTGVTLKRCDCILLMQTCSSAETFIQILFRCMTPNKDKKVASLYNFDSETMLKVVEETINIRQAGTNKTHEECVKELFNVMNVNKFWADNSLEFDITDPVDYLQAIKKLPTDFNYADSIVNIPDSFTNEQLEALSKIQVVAGLKKSEVIATGIGGEIKQKVYKETSEATTEVTKKERNQFVEQLKSLVYNLDWDVDLLDIKDANDLLNNIVIKIDEKTGKMNLVRAN